MPIYEIETDQGTYEIDADREPTQDEALAAIAQQSQPSTARDALQDFATKATNVINNRGERPGLKESTKQTLAEREAFAKQYTEAAKRSLPEKAVELGLSTGKAAVVDPIAAILGAIIPTAKLGIDTLSTGDITPAAATGAEAARRIGLDVINLGKTAVPGLAQAIGESILRGKGNMLAGALPTAISRLSPRTPTEEEIQQAFEALPAQQEMQKARTEVPTAQTPLIGGLEAAFEKANPKVAEGATQLAELAVPVGEAATAIKGSLKGVGQTIANAPRLLRTAIKPTKPVVGQKLEKALENQFYDIYQSNPMAHKEGAIPFEGFAQSVDNTLDNAAQQLTAARNAAGQPVNVGKTLSDRINTLADRVQARGGKAAEVEAIRQRAREVQAINTVEGLQDAVTDAGRKVDWNSPKSRADDLVDKEIAVEGSKELNKLFENTQIPGGAQLRKNWSELKLIQEETSKQLNKIINKAPPAIKPLVVEALSSAKGIGGLIGLIHGYGSGALALGSAAAEAFFKKASKELSNSNSIVENLYEGLGKNPPVARPPIIPPARTPVVPPTPAGPAITPQQLQTLQQNLQTQQQSALMQQIAQQLSAKSNVPRIFLPE